MRGGKIGRSMGSKGEEVGVVREEDVGEFRAEKLRKVSGSD